MQLPIWQHVLEIGGQLVDALHAAHVGHDVGCLSWGADAVQLVAGIAELVFLARGDDDFGAAGLHEGGADVVADA